jgi:hypothetical protein
MRLCAALESRFIVTTKYFLRTREMAYALAVARVDEAIERMRFGRGKFADDLLHRISDNAP